MIVKVTYKIFIGFPRKIYFSVLNFYREKLLLKFPNLFRFSSRPYLTGDTLRKIADHVFDDGRVIDLKKVSNGDIIFVQSNYIDDYFEKYSPKINKKHFLISHNHFSPITDKYLENLNDNLILWFAENLSTSTKHEKLKALPLGIENLKKFKNGIRSHFESKEVKLNQEKKEKLVLSSFAPHTSFENREQLSKIVQKLKYVDIATYPDHKTYILNLSKYKFNICPPGVGYDTHRYWESLIVKTIPICIKNEFTSYLKTLYPIVVLDKWDDLDFNSLNKIYLQANWDNYDSLKLKNILT